MHPQATRCTNEHFRCGNRKRLLGRNDQHTIGWIQTQCIPDPPPQLSGIPSTQPCIHLGHFNQFIIRQITRMIGTPIQTYPLLTLRKTSGKSTTSVPPDWWQYQQTHTPCSRTANKQTNKHLRCGNNPASRIREVVHSINQLPIVYGTTPSSQ